MTSPSSDVSVNKIRQSDTTNATIKLKASHVFTNRRLDRQCKQSLFGSLRILVVLGCFNDWTGWRILRRPKEYARPSVSFLLVSALQLYTKWLELVWDRPVSRLHTASKRLVRDTSAKRHVHFRKSKFPEDHSLTQEHRPSLTQGSLSQGQLVSYHCGGLFLR